MIARGPLAKGRPAVVVVTGGSRGAGRGIAIALGAHGCTVYVTGRSEKPGDHVLSGTIYETAEAVTAAGGKGVALRCDHADDAQVKAVFDRVLSEQGQIDILVNNVAAVHDELSQPGNFWEKPLKLGDMIDVGLRSGYVATWLAAPAMVKHARGLVVFTSASGAVHYSLGPAYGAHKAGMDKMASDMAVDFRAAGAAVSAVSIWMGALATDRLLGMIGADESKLGYLRDQIETPEFTGHVIWSLYNDPALSEFNGETLIGAELAARYGLTDVDGRTPPSYRESHKVEPQALSPRYPVKRIQPSARRGPRKIRHPEHSPKPDANHCDVQFQDSRTSPIASSVMYALSRPPMNAVPRTTAFIT